MNMNDFSRFTNEYKTLLDKYLAQTQKEDNAIISCELDNDLCLLTKDDYYNNYMDGIPEIVHAVSKDTGIYSIISINKRSRYMVDLPKSNKLLFLTVNHLGTFLDNVGVYCNDISVYKVISKFLDECGVTNVPMVCNLTGGNIDSLRRISENRNLVISISIPEIIKKDVNNSLAFANILSGLVSVIKSLDISDLLSIFNVSNCILCSRKRVNRSLPYSMVNIGMDTSCCENSYDEFKIAMNILNDKFDIKRFIKDDDYTSSFRKNRFSISSYCRMCGNWFTRKDALKMCNKCRHINVDIATAIVTGKIDLGSLENYKEYMMGSNKITTKKIKNDRYTEYPATSVAVGEEAPTIFNVELEIEEDEMDHMVDEEPPASGTSLGEHERRLLGLAEVTAEREEREETQHEEEHTTVDVAHAFPSIDWDASYHHNRLVRRRTTEAGE